MEFQLYHKIDDVKKCGFKITWKFIQIGYLGCDSLQPQINKQDICKYANEVLIELKSDYDEIAQLIGNQTDEYEFREILNKLVNKEKSNKEMQIQKWIVYLAKEMVDSLQDNYFENLLIMTEFWISLGQPTYSPHIFQFVGNDMLPKEYYTKENYELILNKHIKWIECETQRIIQLEN